jgi:sugar/nucleoside kinase (ribokinase family)
VVIAFLGSACWDRLLRTDRPLAVGRRANVLESADGPGGGELNSASWAASLGAEAVLVAPIGSDPEGEHLRAHFIGAGPECLWLEANEPTKQSLVVIDANSERTILRHAEYPRTPASLPKAIAARVSAAAIVWTRHHDPAFRALAHGLCGPGSLAATRTRDLATELDQGRRWQIAVDSVDECPHPSDELLCDAGVRHCVMTEGGNGGSYWSPERGWRRYEAERAEALVDATGAGDAFLAGLLVGLERGQEIEEALGLGARCGARALAVLGAWPR